MKIFDKKEDFGSKTNFVDENNVCVGYDTEQSCCEHAGWFILESVITAQTIKAEHLDDERESDWDGWTFDVGYFEESGGGDTLDCGGLAVFRLVKDGQERFLHLFNCHNGYYSHGFTMSGGGVDREGSL